MEPAADVFDDVSGEYDKVLNQGLKLSGEGKSYFAEKRVDWTRRRLAEYGMKPSRVMDYGCGTGTSVPLLSGLPGVVEVLGVDVSAKSLDIARRNMKEAGLSEKSRFSLLEEFSPNGGFDLAFTNGVFHHIPPEERAAAMSYVWSSLKPGGFFALWENNPWNPGTRLVMSRVPFDRDAITLSFLETRGRLKSAGFEVWGSDFLFFLPRSLKWLRFVEPWFCKIPLGGQYLVLARKPV